MIESLYSLGRMFNTLSDIYCLRHSHNLISLTLDKCIQIILNLGVDDRSYIIFLIFDESSDLLLNCLQLLYLFRLLLVFFNRLASWDIEKVWLLLNLLLLLHLEYLFPFLHQVYLHTHSFLEALVSEIQDLLQCSLIHFKHLLLVIKKF